MVSKNTDLDDAKSTKAKSPAKSRTSKSSSNKATTEKLDAQTKVATPEVILETSSDAAEPVDKKASAKKTIATKAKATKEKAVKEKPAKEKATKTKATKETARAETATEERPVKEKAATAKDPKEKATKGKSTKVETVAKEQPVSEDSYPEIVYLGRFVSKHTERFSFDPSYGDVSFIHNPAKPDLDSGDFDGIPPEVQQALEQAVDELPDFDKEFLEFLLNNIDLLDEDDDENEMSSFRDQNKKRNTRKKK